jgi:CheY-like chemotaxis protein
VVPRRLLCVDDDAISQRILVATLARPGWSIECVCDARHAIERFMQDASAFDVLVTDHAMPGMDGVELLQRLRALGFRGDAIVVTAGVMHEDAVRYRQLGAAAVLVKPVRASTLLAVVDRSAAGAGSSMSNPSAAVAAASVVACAVG